jgi:hypothetical protein
MSIEFEKVVTAFVMGTKSGDFAQHHVFSGRLRRGVYFGVKSNG